MILQKHLNIAVEQIKYEPVHQIQKFNVSIEEQIEFIENKLKEFPELHFLNLVEEIKEKIRIIVTFIALLELVKMGRIGIKATTSFNDFIITHIENG